jgi:N-formylglutamate deformylase
MKMLAPKSHFLLIFSFKKGKLMILHLPHASRRIPSAMRNQIILDDSALCAELLLLTDAYTDELFAHPKATPIRFDLSRLLIDPERFPDEAMDPMTQMGMGRIYEKTVDGTRLKRVLHETERAKLISFYDAHHAKLEAACAQEIERIGQTLIVDCHSFPSTPLNSDLDPVVDRPAICIGSDPFHTPPELVTSICEHFEALGLRVEENRPYVGTLVPFDRLGKDVRVKSVMIEVNRELYMNEETGEKSAGFAQLQQAVEDCLGKVMQFSLAT